MDGLILDLDDSFNISYVNVLVQGSCNGGSQLLYDNNAQNGQGETIVILMLHDVNLLAAQVGGEADAKHVRTCDDIRSN